MGGFNMKNGKMNGQKRFMNGNKMFEEFPRLVPKSVDIKDFKKKNKK